MGRRNGKWIAATLAGLLGTVDASDVRAVGLPSEAGATSTTVKLPAGPSSIRGLAEDPSVDRFSGQVSYQVPLELPRAARNFAPRVSLDYSGELGNGQFGIGWRVGVPSIRRSLDRGVPTYKDDVDSLELGGLAGGGRLIAVPGTSEYRVEGEGNTIRVIRLATGGFKVHAPDGSVLTLGVSAAARQAAGGKIARWMVEDLTDVAGQKVVYEYLTHRNEIYLSKIRYGAGNAFEVRFDLEDRADGTDSRRLGFLVETDKRVVSIGVFAHGSKIRNYQLTYDSTLPLSRLAKVRLVGKGGVDAMPALTFGYTRRSAATAQQLATSGWTLSNDTTFVDIDGDGASDLLRTSASTHEYRRNLGGSFASPVLIGGAPAVQLSTARFADVEGKARANLIGTKDGRWEPFRLVNGQWKTMGAWENTKGLPLRGDQVALTDLNGDGRVDAVRDIGTGIEVRFGTSTGFSAPFDTGYIGGHEVNSENVRWHDVNGDGLGDLLALTENKIVTFTGVGDGTFVQEAGVNYPWGGNRPTFLSDLRFADLDRDGLLDAIRINGSDVEWFAGLPGGVFGASQGTLPNPTSSNSATVTIVDANGNGSEDVVWSSPPQGGMPGAMWALDLAGPTNAGMLTSVDNGMGQLLVVDYEATTLIAGKSSQPWTWTLPISMPVAVRTTITPAPGAAPRVTELSVRDGFWDGTENRFGGFLSGTYTRLGSGETMVETTRYNQGVGIFRVLRGRPLEVHRYRMVAGQLLLVDRTVNVWSAAEVAGLPSSVAGLRRAVLSSTVISYHEGLAVGAPVPQTRTKFAYDTEARLLQESQEGRLDRLGDERTIKKTYASSTTPWVRDLVAEEQIFDGVGTLVSSVRNTYGDETGSGLPLGQAGKGWLRKSEAFLASENRWVVRNQTTVDALGNPLKVVANGVERTFTFDATGRLPLTETLLTSAGKSLTWKMTWDETLGVPKTLTTATGIVHSATYDGLARPVTQATNSTLPHTVFRYLWEGALPRNEVFRFAGRADQLTVLPATWTPASGWRHEVQVANGAGEDLYTATRLAASKWLVSDWNERDERGRVIFMGETIEVDGNGTFLSKPASMAGQAVKYDGLDRVVEQRLPDGTRTTSSYKLFSAETRPDGLAPTVLERDGQGRIVINQRETSYAQVRWDAMGRQVGVDVFAGGPTGTKVSHDFVYDTLGRLIQAASPDAGVRTMKYDDGDRLLNLKNSDGQQIDVTYDLAGRPTKRVFDGKTFSYFYDLAKAGSGSTFTQGKLAWVQEPTGHVVMSYDQFGNQTLTRRVFGTIGGEQATTYSTLGEPVRVVYDGGAVDFSLERDPAGRMLKAGSYWHAESQDGAGRILAEKYGNGVRQTYVRDVLGLPARVDVLSPTGSVYYGATISRTPYGAATEIVDDDGRGLDHSASFDYDLRGRMIGSSNGSGADAFAFTYGYDDLQNLISRTAVGPRDIGVKAGLYVYGEPGNGPRQLTSIVTAAGTKLHTFDYDNSGRMTKNDGRVLAFNVVDQITQVTLPGGAKVNHVYGFDDQRIRTQSPSGKVKLWLAPGVTEENGVREYSISIGSRVVAEIRVASSTGGSQAVATVDARWSWLAAMGLLSLAMFALALHGRSRHGVATRLSAATMVVAVLQGCGVDQGSLGASQHALTPADVTYFHQSVSVGPVVFTGKNGELIEERRYEAFGQPIDAQRGSATASIDFSGIDWNMLNKQTEPATGYSDHGARWFAADHARWLSADPAGFAPRDEFASDPSKLHPYSYGDNNPTLYWDPDGRWAEESVTVWLPVQRKSLRSELAIEIEERNNFFAAVWKSAFIAYGVVGAVGGFLAGEALDPVESAEQAWSAGEGIAFALTAGKSQGIQESGEMGLRIGLGIGIIGAIVYGNTKDIRDRYENNTNKQMMNRTPETRIFAKKWNTGIAMGIESHSLMQTDQAEYKEFLFKCFGDRNFSTRGMSKAEKNRWADIGNMNLRRYYSLGPGDDNNADY